MLCGELRQKSRNTRCIRSSVSYPCTSTPVSSCRCFLLVCLLAALVVFLLASVLAGSVPAASVLAANVLAASVLAAIPLLLLPARLLPACLLPACLLPACLLPACLLPSVPAADMQAQWPGGYWLPDMTMQCWTGAHRFHALLPGVPLSIICVLIPSLPVLLLWRSRKQLQTNKIRSRVGFIYRPYR